MKLAAIAFLVSGATLAQEPAKPDFRADVSLVLLHAKVEDNKGHAVGKLPKEAFQVYEDGARQQITVFSSDDVPITVGLVIDNSGSMLGRKSEVVSAALAFARASNPADEVFVIHFNDYVGYGLPEGRMFTDDIGELERAFEGFAPSGKTALYDALVKAIDHLSRGKHDKKALVVVSDGGDNASRTTFDKVLEMADRSGALIYTIGIFDATQDDKNPGVIRRLAKATGGESYLPADIGEVKKVCIGIAEDLRSQYTIGYVPNRSGGDSAYHKVRVTASSPNQRGLKVRAREGYYGKTPAK